MTRIDRRRAADVLGLAHELRTPLTSLTLAAGLLEDERALTASQRELARTIAREAARIRLVLDRALRTDRLGAYAGPIDRAPLELGALVRQALAPLVAQGEARSVAIEARLAEIVIVGDVAKLGWAVASLIGNGLRFAPPATAVEVVVARVRGGAELSVRDHGPGIPVHRRRAVLSREGGGSLFLIQEIVHAHGGTIRVARSAPGAKIVVSLPLAPEHPR